MDNEHWSAARALFESALDHSPDERERYLAAQPHTEPEVLAEARRLLALHEGEGPSLEPPAAEELAKTIVTQPVVGRMLGPYRLKRVLGAGGMGTVYEAEQEHPRRTVAVKVVAAGWGGTRARERFREEVDLLARLDHPGIARILDAGAELGPADTPLPWYAMELVPGALPLTGYADHHELDLAARLELLAQVCDALHYGHLNGVIHRDIKPGNVLVDAEGCPKVIDFGVARATDPAARHYTEVGEFVGTLDAMAPEQLDGQADVRSDVYALGALLYQLVGGRPPHDSTGVPLDEAMRAVRHEEPRPLNVLRPDVPVEVSWVAQKALAKNPAERYASVAELARDLRRCLGSQPLLAGAPGTWWRTRRFARRHRLAVSIVSLVVVLLGGGIWGTTRGLLAAIEARTEAEARRHDAERAATEADVARSHERVARLAAEEESAKSTAVTELMVELFTRPDPSLDGHEVTVVAALEHAEQRLAEDLAGQPDVEAALRHALGRVHFNLGLPERAEEHLQRALALWSGPAHGNPETVHAVHADLGTVLGDQRRHAEAEQHAAIALAWRREQLGEDHADTIASLGHMALLKHDAVEYDSAEAIYRDAIERAVRTFGDDHERTWTLRANLAALLTDQRLLDDADELLTPAVAALRRVVGESSPLALTHLENLGGLRAAQGRIDEATTILEQVVEALERVLPADHPRLVAGRSNLAALHVAAGRHDRARELLDALVHIIDERHARLSPESLTAHFNLAKVHHAAGDRQAALDEVSTILAEDPGARTTQVRSAQILEWESGWYTRIGERDVARELCVAALGARRRLQSPGHADTLMNDVRLAQIENLLGDVEAASQRMDSIWKTASGSLAVGSYARAAISHEYAVCLMRQGRFDESEAVLLPAVASLEELGTDAERSTAYASCITLYESWGRTAEAAHWRQRRESPADG